MKNKQCIPLYMDTPLGLSFLLCTSSQQKKQKFCRGSFNEHSYQVWFLLVLWFQRRRLKFNSLRTSTMTDGHGRQVMAIPHMTLGQVELKSLKFEIYPFWAPFMSNP